MTRQTRSGRGQPSEPGRGGRPKSDFYATDPAYSSALFEALAWRNRLPKSLWEPACGDGALARVAEAYGVTVIASNLYGQGYGEVGVDFLKVESLAWRSTTIITNPPWSGRRDKNLPLRFLEHAQRLGAKEIWLLLPLGWIASDFRRERVFPGLADVWIVNSRAPMWPYGVAPPDARPNPTMTEDCAWFGWHAGARFSGPRLALIDPAPAYQGRAGERRSSVEGA